MEIEQLKTKLRKMMLSKRSELDPIVKQQHDHDISNRLIDYVETNNCRVVHTYLPMGKELNHTRFISYCLQEHITVVITKTLRKPEMQHLILEDLSDLTDGVFGTRFPRSEIEWTGGYDLIIVPGLAFDDSGNRLGYGGGYYDHFLAEHPSVYKVAIGYPFQKIDFVPANERDMAVDEVFVPIDRV